MALDGIFLSALAKEFNDDLQGAKVEKINQPERDEIVISLHAPARQKNKHVKLVISVDPAHPVIYLSENAGKEDFIDGSDESGYQMRRKRLRTQLQRHELLPRHGEDHLRLYGLHLLR